MINRCPLSVLIPVKNEEGNLRACIESARFADEIVVVDSNSTDRTREIAESMGARVVDFNWNGQFPKKKNWALAHLPWKHEWIFILDADERITPALAAEITILLSQPALSATGFYVNRRFWFIDGWLNHCGYYPSWNLRLFRHAAGRYEQLDQIAATGSGDNEVHEHVLLAGPAGHLKQDMEHYAFPTVAIWVEKHNRYSNWEASLLNSDQARADASSGRIDPVLSRKRRLKRRAARLPFRPTLRFFYHYVWKRGFLDGYRGLVFCRLMAIYEFLGQAKAVEQRLSPRATRHH